MNLIFTFVIFLANASYQAYTLFRHRLSMGHLYGPIVNSEYSTRQLNNIARYVL